MAGKICQNGLKDSDNQPMSTNYVLFTNNEVKIIQYETNKKQKKHLVSLIQSDYITRMMKKDSG